MLYHRATTANEVEGDPLYRPPMYCSTYIAAHVVLLPSLYMPHLSKGCIPRSSNKAIELHMYSFATRDHHKQLNVVLTLVRFC